MTIYTITLTFYFVYVHLQPTEKFDICDRILENRRYTHNSTFVIKRILKLWVKMQAPEKKCRFLSPDWWEK